jgi:hypothetical protein
MLPWGTAEARVYMQGESLIMGLPYGKTQGVHLVNKIDSLKSLSPDNLLELVAKEGFICTPADGTVIILPNDYIYYILSQGSRYFRWSVMSDNDTVKIRAHDSYQRIYTAYPTLRQTTYKHWGSILHTLATS